MLRSAVMIFVPAVVLCVSLASGQQEREHWHAFQPLVGQWRGEGSGFGNVADVTHPSGSRAKLGPGVRPGRYG